MLPPAGDKVQICSLQHTRGLELGPRPQKFCLFYIDKLLSESARGNPLICVYGVRIKESSSRSRAARFGIDASLMDEMYRLELDDARRVPSNIGNLGR